MSMLVMGTTAGLGIELTPPTSSEIRPSASGTPPHLSQRSQDGTNSSECFSGNKEQELATQVSRKGASTLRMQELLLAESGGAMVQLDVHDGGPSLKSGQRIAPELVTPGGGSRIPHTRRSRRMTVPGIVDANANLARHGTLLTAGATLERNTAELKLLLGNSNMRLKPGAKVLPPAGSDTLTPFDPGYESFGKVALEQAKPRARVTMDILLENDVCVQGGYLNGRVKIRVRERAKKKEAPLMLADAKVRVIGFETIPEQRHTFYQHAARLVDIAPAAEIQKLFASPPDEEGYAEVRDGVYIIPFSMFLPLQGQSGNAKGTLYTTSGPSVQYVAVVSVKLKELYSNYRSMAHFCRTCEAWPRLDPSAILLPAPRPIQCSASDTLFLGGSGRLGLTAYLHRLHWLAGQRVSVKVAISNDTKKTVKTITLTLVRTLTIFKPKPNLNCGLQKEMDMDSCQTSTTKKVVGESVLEMGQNGSRGHASAKGWWLGVRPRQEAAVWHSLVIPPDALSIPRGRLLEVRYTVRVSILAGSMGSAVGVTLPINIVNFASVDPPPSEPIFTREVRRPLPREPPGCLDVMHHGCDPSGPSDGDCHSSRFPFPMADKQSPLDNDFHSIDESGDEDEGFYGESDEGFERNSYADDESGYDTEAHLGRAQEDGDGQDDGPMDAGIADHVLSSIRDDEDEEAIASSHDQEILTVRERSRDPSAGRPLPRARSKTVSETSNSTSSDQSTSRLRRQPSFALRVQERLAALRQERLADPRESDPRESDWTDEQSALTQQIVQQASGGTTATYDGESTGVIGESRITLDLDHSQDSVLPQGNPDVLTHPQSSAASLPTPSETTASTSSLPLDPLGLHHDPPTMNEVLVAEPKKRIGGQRSLPTPPISRDPSSTASESHHPSSLATRPIPTSPNAVGHSMSCASPRSNKPVPLRRPTLKTDRQSLTLRTANLGKPTPTAAHADARVSGVRARIAELERRVKEDQI